MSVRPDVLTAARGAVKQLLTESDAFHALPAAERTALANGMVKIASYLAAGERGDTPPHALQLGDKRLVRAADTASDRMKKSGAAAAEAGVDALGDAVKKVDFPQFVSGLIDGVFNAIVKSSIQQMEAYAELVKNVAKSVDDFMKDNVTENQARDYLADKYPDHIDLNLEGEAPRAQVKQGVDATALPDFMKDLGLPEPVTAIDDDTVENTLVPAARQRLALDRQHLLLTMVMMGVNRLVVTDGSIKASVVFQLDTKDSVKARQSRSATRDSEENIKDEKRPGFFAWFKPYTNTDRTAKFTTHTVDASSLNSDSQVDLHTKLTGDVNLRFKSETFPLDKMSDLIGRDLQEEVKSKSVTTQKSPAIDAGPPPALPPLPPLQGKTS